MKFTKNEDCSKADGGNDCTAMWMYIMLLNYMLKKWLGGTQLNPQ